MMFLYKQCQYKSIFERLSKYKIYQKFQIVPIFALTERI